MLFIIMIGVLFGFLVVSLLSVCNVVWLVGG